MPRKQDRRRFGQITKLPSGRYRARYADPEGRLTHGGEPVRHNAPHTFESKIDAEAWLTDERRMVSAGTWTTPAERLATKTKRPLSLGEFADAWLANRKVKGQPLAARTRDHYRDLLDNYILPTFAETPIAAITPEDVDHWYELAAVGKPTTQAHAYSLLRTILGTAVDRGIIKTANPAKVRGGGSTKAAIRVEPASMDELGLIVEAMPERQQLLILLAAWCALRFGELAELRRTDVDTKNGVLKIRRGVVRSKSEGVVQKKPKSDAGIRDVAIPPHLMPLVRSHLLEHAQPGRDGLLFPADHGGNLNASTFYGRAATLNRDGTIKRAGWGWYEARRVAGRGPAYGVKPAPGTLRFHDLRHTGAVLAAQTGATLAELMNRLGHSTPAAALRYQHAAADRDKEIARRLSEFANGGSA